MYGVHLGLPAEHDWLAFCCLGVLDTSPQKPLWKIFIKTGLAFSSEKTGLRFCFGFTRWHAWKLNQAWHCRRCWKIQQCASPQPTCQGTLQVRCHRIVLCLSDCTQTSVESNKQRVEADTLPSTHTNLSVLSHGLPGRYQLSIRGDVSDVSIPFRPWPCRPTRWCRSSPMLPLSSLSNSQ